MKNNGRGPRPYLPPVKRIVLPEGNEKLRWIAIVVLLAIGVTAIAMGVYSLVNVEPGWQSVEITSQVPNTAGDFALQYDFTGMGAQATVRMRELSELYRQASEKAWLLFSAPAVSPNEILTVEPELYDALGKITETTAPYFFLAPVMEEYDRMFLCQDDGEAARYDPNQNPEIAEYLSQIAAFVTDPAQISLELLGENRVRLNVGAEYLAFAEENGIESFFDFGWMKNAFVADYLAAALSEKGFTRGYLASYDGFTRNLDDRGIDYSVNIFDRRGNDLYRPAKLTYSGPMSLVFLRNYPQTAQDRWHFYAYESGKAVSAFVDPADGRDKTAIGTLLSYSKTAGCADILLNLLPVFVADTFDPAPLEAMAAKNIHTIWSEGATLRHTEKTARIEGFPDQIDTIK